jgi:hypothetical protein
MSLFLSPSQVLFLRLRCQRLLAQPDQPASIEQVLSDVCGVQAQDLSAGELSAGVRLPGLTLAQVEAARLQPRSILRIWSMRGTLHLMTARDACWLNPLLGPRSNAADGRRMAQLGWDEERVARATRLVLEYVEAQGGITRPELARLFAEQHLPHTGQAPIHLLGRLVNGGFLCQGPDRGKQPLYVPFEQWAGPLQPLPEDDALAELARRYLAAYAPAGPQDLAAWSGLKVSEARRAWELLGAELVPVETDEEPLWLLKTQSDAFVSGIADPGPQVLADLGPDGIADPVYRVLRLLPRFDTYLLGYRDRHRILAPELKYKLNSGGGILPATLLLDGRLAGIWSSKPAERGSNPPLLLTIRPFEPLPERWLLLLEQEVTRVGRFLGVETVWEII